MPTGYNILVNVGLTVRLSQGRYVLSGDCLSISRTTQNTVDEFGWNLLEECNVRVARNH